MFRGLGMFCADSAQPVTTAGEELDDLHDFVRGGHKSLTALVCRIFLKKLSPILLVLVFLVSVLLCIPPCPER